jgi:hypothetical protein
MVGRAAVGVVLVAAGLAGCGFGGSADAGARGATSEPTDKGVDLAGEVGPAGGIISGGIEMQSTPAALYDDQTDGGTAIVGVDGVTAGLTVIRDGERLCLELHGLPIGGNRLAGTCDIPAYASHAEVDETAWAYVSDIVVGGEPVRVAWGMTYLDAVSAEFGTDTRSQALESGMPFWMHRFFALEAPAQATEIRLLDEDGQQLVTVPLEDHP